MFRLVLFMLLVVGCQGKFLKGGVRGYGGDCPYQRPAVMCEASSFFGEESTCYGDEDCSPSLKCCQQGCVTKCVTPVPYYKKWCSAPLDVGILFDAKSGPLLQKVKKMIYRVIRGMSLAEENTHVSLGTIAPDRSILMTFDDFVGGSSNAASIWKVLKAVKPGTTRGSLSKALYMAKNMFNKAKGAREGAIKVLLVFTDAVGTMDEDLEGAASVLRESGILVEAIGIGMDIDLFNLMTVATSDMHVWHEVDEELLLELGKLEKEPCHR